MSELKTLIDDVEVKEEGPAEEGITKHDFRDGNGPVPAAPHPHGGGWVADTASVSTTAYVGHCAEVFGDAIVRQNVKIQGEVRVYGRAMITDNVRVSGHAEVFDDAELYDNVVVNGQARVYGNAQISNHVTVGARFAIEGDCHLYGVMYLNEDDGIPPLKKSPISITGGVPYALFLTEHGMYIGCTWFEYDDAYKMTVEDIVHQIGVTPERARQFGVRLRAVLDGLTPFVEPAEETKKEADDDNI